MQDLLSVVTRRVSAMEDPAAVQWAVDIMLKLKVTRGEMATLC
jgi:hypothetical protein